ncbi:MAG: hypothetical protein Q4G46_04160 [Propionibacteriaceae bacterium]|nr:hypothetical protein [Propionibacteriaceae bacterium]
MTATTDRPNAGQLALLRYSSLATAIAALLQFLLGGYMFTSPSATLADTHNIIGLVTIGVSLIATIAGFVNRSRGGNSGLAFHILGTFILTLVQFSLGEIGLSGSMVMVHMALGTAILVSAIAMTTLAFRKPFARS